MEDKLRITITVAGKRFSMSVPRKNEEMYRRAAEQLSKKIEEYARRSPDMEESDILAQAAFYMSLHLQFLKETHTPEMKAITDICEDIEAILPSQE